MERQRNINSTKLSGHLPIGETFVDRSDNTELKVTKAAKKGLDACEGCYYRGAMTTNCHVTPNCKWWSRQDGNDVVFTLNYESR